MDPVITIESATVPPTPVTPLTSTPRPCSGEAIQRAGEDADGGRDAKDAEQAGGAEAERRPRHVDGLHRAQVAHLRPQRAHLPRPHRAAD